MGWINDLGHGFDDLFHHPREGMTELQGVNNRAYELPWSHGILPQWSQPGGFLGNYQKHLFNTSTSADPGAGYIKDYYGFRSDGEGKGHALGDTGANALGSAAILAAIFGGGSLASGGSESGGSSGSSGITGVDTSTPSLDVTSGWDTNASGGYDLTGNGSGSYLTNNAYGDFGSTPGSAGGGSSGSGFSNFLHNFNYKKLLSSALGKQSGVLDQRSQAAGPSRHEMAAGDYNIQPSALNPVAGGESGGSGASPSPYSAENYGAYGAPSNNLYQKMIAAALSNQNG